MKNLLTIVLMFSVTISLGQNQKTNSISKINLPRKDTTTYLGNNPSLDSVASYMGSRFGVQDNSNFHIYLHKYLHNIPSSKIDCEDDKKIYFHVTVNEIGEIKDVKIFKLDPDSSCYKVLYEAIYSSSGKWTPAIINKQRVKNRFTCTFTYYKI